MSAKSPPWNLTIPSYLGLLPLVRSFIEVACAESGCDVRTTDAVVMATDEAVNNIMRHAHRGHPEATVQIQCLLRPDRIEVRLLDEGEPFDLDAVPALDPSEIRIGGRGVFLMRTLMDELSCHPRGEQGNTLHMVKYRPAPPLLRGA